MKSIVISAALLLVGGNVVWGDLVGPVFTGLACPSNVICDEDSALSNITAGTPSAQFTVQGFSFDSSAIGSAFEPDAGIGAVLDDPAAGIYNYSLSEDECCDLPAILQHASIEGRDHPGDAPKPAAWLLVATGLAAVIRQLCS